MPRYRITNGSFRLDAGNLAGPGDTIELGEDIAAQHPDKVTLVIESSEPTPDSTDAQPA